MTVDVRCEETVYEKGNPVTKNFGVSCARATISLDAERQLLPQLKLIILPSLYSILLAATEGSHET